MRAQQDEPRALRYWRSRPILEASQWRELYSDLQALFLRASARGLGNEAQGAYPQFFLRYVVETTASNPRNIGWLRELVREFGEEQSSSDELKRTLASLPKQGPHRSPPLAQVEHGLFRVADRFLFDAAARIGAGESFESLQLEPELAARVCRMLDDVGGAEDEPKAPIEEMPEAVARYVERKTSATAALTAMDRPRSGQIVAVENLVGPKGEIDEDLARPLCVLIDRPTETPEVYWGWMVGAEPDYASEADFVLAVDDEPRDPIAANVQLWNPVRVYWPTVSRVIGQMAPHRMAALHALAADFLVGDGGLDAGTPASDAPDRFLVRRTTDGEAVITGTAMSGDTDVRALYQTLYFGAADVLMQPALQAEAAWAAERQAAWIQDAEVQAEGLYRFTVRGRGDPDHTVQLIFEPPGSADPLVVLQRRGTDRDDTPLVVDGQRVEFQGGIARPSAGQAEALARALGLPTPFDHWPAAASALQRSNGATDAVVRRVLGALLERAKSMAKDAADVFDFALGKWAEPGLDTAVRGEAAQAGDARAIVAGIESVGSQGMALHLLLESAVQIDTVEVVVNGETAAPSQPVRWSEPGAVLHVDGLAPDPAWIARARLRGGHLFIDFSR